MICIDYNFYMNILTFKQKTTLNEWLRDQHHIELTDVSVINLEADGTYLIDVIRDDEHNIMVTNGVINHRAITGKGDFPLQLGLRV